jgi:hypothetical protein
MIRIFGTYKFIANLFAKKKRINLPKFFRVEKYYIFKAIKLRPLIPSCPEPNLGQIIWPQKYIFDTKEFG